MSTTLEPSLEALPRPKALTPLPGQSPSSPLTVLFCHRRSTSWLSLQGHLDADAVSELTRFVEELALVHPRLVVLDLRELRTIDEAGARAVDGLQHYAAGLGSRVSVLGKAAVAIS